MIEPRTTRLVLVLAALAAAHGRGLAAQDGERESDESSVIARVNGEAVTRAELRRVLDEPAERRWLQQEADASGAGGAAVEDLALRALVQRRLILQEARRRKLSVTERELDDAITSLRRRFQDLRGLGEWMKEQGLDDGSLLETLRAELLAARVRAALVEDVRVSEAQLRQHHEAHAEDLRGEEVWIQVIAVEERRAAEEILAALRAGADFGALARARSVGRRARQGGDLGWVDVAKLGPPLREAIGTLRAGEARGPLERGNELLLVRLQARRPGRAKTLAEARPELERRLLPAAQREAVRSWLAAQERSARIEILAARDPRPRAETRRRNPDHGGASR